MSRLSWRASFAGLPLTAEGGEAVAGASPSDSVVADVVTAFRYLTRAQVLRRSAKIVAAVTLAMIALAVGVVFRAVREARHQASLATARRLASVASEAWRTGTRPVDEILLIAAQSLDRAATSEALQLAHDAVRLYTPRRARIPTPRDFKYRVSVSSDQRWSTVVAGDRTLTLIDVHRGVAVPVGVQCEQVGNVSFAAKDGSFAFPCERAENDHYFFVTPGRTAKVQRLPAPVDGVGDVVLATAAPLFLINRIRGDRTPQLLEARRLSDGAVVWSRSAYSIAAARGILAVVNEQGTVELLDEKTGKTMAGPLRQHGVQQGFAVLLSWSPDGQRLAIVWAYSARRTATVHDAATGNWIVTIPLPDDFASEEFSSDSQQTPEEASFVTFSSDGSKLLAGKALQNGRVELWNENWGQYWRKWQYVTPIESQPRFLADGRRFHAVAGGAASIFEIGDNVPIEVARMVGTTRMNQTSGTEDVLTVDEEAVVELWRPARPRPDTGGWSPELDATANVVMFGTAEGHALIDLASGRTISSFARDDDLGGGLVSATLSARAEHIVLGGSKVLRVYARRNDRLERLVQFALDSEDSYQLRMSPSGTIVVAGSVRQGGGQPMKVRVLGVAGGTVMDQWTPRAHLQSLDVSDAGRLVAVNDGRILVRDAGRRRDLCTMPPPAGTKYSVVAVSKEGRIAAGTDDGRVLVGEPCTVMTQAWIGGSIAGLRFTMDEERVAAVSRLRDRSRLASVSAADGRLLAEVTLPHPYVQQAVETADGQSFRFVYDREVRTVAMTAAAATRSICEAADLSRFTAADWSRIAGGLDPLRNVCRR